MAPKRYFEDERTAKPGVISNELRAALNLHDDKLPMWIYKMRVLGYPPGWLQQADISSSSLQLFDDSSQVNRSTTSQVQEQAFNPECFVEFPGFNAPVPVGVKDHCEILGMPPMQGFQQLNYVKQTILPPKPVPYKRIKLSKNDSDTKNGTLSMDDGDDEDNNENDEVQIIDEPNKTAKQIKTIEIKDVEEREEGEASDSDDEIIAINSSTEEPIPKVQQNSSNVSTTNEKIPLSQSPRNDSILIVSPCKLDSLPSTSSSSSQPPPTESIQEKTVNDNNDDKPEAEKEMEKSTVNESASASSTSTATTTTTAEIQGEDKQSSDNSAQPPEESSTIQAQVKSPSIKLIGMGCPLPADIDSKKPPLEKFAVGMGELIYFENLPTSTGVFDKMRHVIFKVRKKLSE